jgi:hypothetical protein
MASRARLSISLVALVFAACLPSVGSSQYAPKWRVGDWWVVKTLQRSMSGLGRGWDWNYTRYDIVGVEKVREQNCYVLKTRHQGRDGVLSRVPYVFYVRTDNWLVVREVVTTTFNDTLLSPVITDCPLGLFGPFTSEPRLPRFPLQLENLDTAFRLKKRDDCSAWLREMSDVAGTNQVSRLLDEGDTAGGRVVRPSGVVYRVRSELGGNLEPVLPGPGEKRITQSLQLWCLDQPWCVYEELVQYNGEKLVPFVEERSWLIASGHADK